MIAFGHHLKVPVIGLSASFLPPWMIDILGNPTNLAFAPNTVHDCIKDMNFWNRLMNVLYTAYAKVYFNYYISIQTDLVKQYFGFDVSNVRELEKDVALVLVNSHHSLSGVKPTVPGHIEVGGLHIHDDNIEIPSVKKFFRI